MKVKMAVTLSCRSSVPYLTQTSLDKAKMSGLKSRDTVFSMQYVEREGPHPPPPGLVQLLGTVNLGKWGGGRGIIPHILFSTAHHGATYEYILLEN